MELPTLYKKASTGNTQEWTVKTEGNTIITRWGVRGGKIQETRDIIKEGKNLGRANATTAQEQAEDERGFSAKIWNEGLVPFARKIIRYPHVMGVDAFFMGEPATYTIRVYTDKLKRKGLSVQLRKHKDSVAFRAIYTQGAKTYRGVGWESLRRIVHDDMRC